ncbi:MAG: glutamine--fructose-6-phosphate transaminase (isomerizing) [Deltaproteobacteria bacterium]|nr:glutamine--fructose-6-phosphate transaminase (isomerizing) [Deltaproteobacteria bacterium]
MCGIIGYIGEREAPQILLEGLKRLEYRGYDSAGMAVIDDGKIKIKRNEGKLDQLERSLCKDPLRGKVGIGHTRWATHGKPSETNAHPHKAGSIVVIHNGIIENYLNLKKSLEKKGHTFKSETDTEIIAHLIQNYLFKGNSFEQAVRNALKRIKGSYAIGVICEEEPKKLIAARNESPLVIGLGEQECFMASDIPAFLSHTKKVIFLDDGEMAVLSEKGVKFNNLSGKKISKEVKTIDWSPSMAEKSGFKHFMQKEIFEQPRAFIDTFRGRIAEEKGKIFMEDCNLTSKEVKHFEKIYIVACGTSWHAAIVGKFMIEGLCRIPVEVDLGSEFRYRDPLLNKKTLLLLISQSGETADTLAALREGLKKKARIISICNVVDSSIVRSSHGVIYTHAGPEIGVASTKAFTTQLVVLYLLALHLGKLTRRLSTDKEKSLIKDLVKLPRQVEKILEEDSTIRTIAHYYMNYRDFLYLGRGINYPIALEGALKLKEISYIHAEGYPAGEMKHGPIALIDEQMPVVVLVPKGVTFDKIMSNVEEVKARGGKIIAVAPKISKEISSKADIIIKIPENNGYLMPILFTIPLQLLAYHIAEFKGTDVDQPRNLAKSVTVE